MWNRVLTNILSKSRGNSNAEIEAYKQKKQFGETKETGGLQLAASAGQQNRD